MADETRLNYRTLSEAEKEAVAKVKGLGQDFLDACNEIGIPSREMSLAKTKIEEAVMWAVKSITG